VSKKAIFDQTPYRTTYVHEHADGTGTFNTVQDVEPILEQNKKEYNAYGDKRTMGKRGEWHKAASIPFNVWERWMQETNGAIQRDSKLLAKYLNDPDNKYFKVAPTNI
jgi:hypothetical protein|tara:strand:- start:524 stop:847 length:324 start_codon:yes stop_codon:yes gene_type:complete